VYTNGPGTHSYHMGMPLQLAPLSGGCCYLAHAAWQGHGPTSIPWVAAARCSIAAPSSDACMCRHRHPTAV
jgi:hypothetical protein